MHILNLLLEFCKSLLSSLLAFCDTFGPVKSSRPTPCPNPKGNPIVGDYRNQWCINANAEHEAYGCKRQKSMG